MKLNGTRKAFHKGGNSSNRFHIRQHYSTYKDRCEKAHIPIHHWATPPNIVKLECEATKAAEAAAAGQEAKAHGQQQLGFVPMIGPHEFTRPATLHTVAKLIATNNQVSFLSVALGKRTHNKKTILAPRACR